VVAGTAGRSFRPLFSYSQARQSATVKALTRLDKLCVTACVTGKYSGKFMNEFKGGWKLDHELPQSWETIPQLSGHNKNICRTKRLVLTFG
jgi:hypothetical protein